MNFNNYSPRSFGWHEPSAAQIIPFRFNGVSFGGGVHRAVEPIFREALRRILPGLPGGLHAGWCWGYAHRPKRGGTDLSFHAYGLALDINAPDNPFVATGRPYRHTMPANTAELVRPLGLEWGGVWSKPKDYMHIEFHGSPDEAVALLATLLDKPAPAKPKPGVPPKTETFRKGARPGSRALRAGTAGDDVRFVQRWIGSKWCGPADGYFGAATTAGVRHYQQMRGLAADGIVGPATWHDMRVT
jgi:hypothetical protein